MRGGIVAGDLHSCVSDGFFVLLKGTEQRSCRVLRIVETGAQWAFAIGLFVILFFSLQSGSNRCDSMPVAVGLGNALPILIGVYPPTTVLSSFPPTVLS
ncbi:MAG: hypothetical protein IPM83_03740 [Ignavibacteria bacterium]|nr:hypothetical protein [Ignavibacteria bacterium]